MWIELYDAGDVGIRALVVSEYDEFWYSRCWLSGAEEVAEELSGVYPGVSIFDYTGR